MKELIRVLLADDDIDDRLLFQDALSELPVPTDLTTVNDGEQLIKKLFEENQPPEVLFLDLNMPRKNGFECLNEIRANEKTKDIPVIIFSTSFNPDIIRLLHRHGARYYIRKPDEFDGLKLVLRKGLNLIRENVQVEFDHFVLNP